LGRKIKTMNERSLNNFGWSDPDIVAKRRDGLTRARKIRAVKERGYSAINFLMTGHTFDQIAEICGRTKQEIARAVGDAADNEYARFVR